ncbi:uncharacterized protein N7482_000674 [Penicillium canariense]|uniref:ATPase, vacuolar ER assembly factor, Vma12 n=1 Tax=Penicillium canariense TaxID=189055 RepID=A0A9W9LTD0_9EURO|nr:uncharacterized protein N7482_000674 [Penicillium canariense]KAJ5174797.1 hypothetical protein N7482_000674 [Penicillium canariense]
MVLLATTDRIRAALEAVPASQRQELDLPAPAALERDGPIAHEQLLRLAKQLQNDATYNASADDSGLTVLNALLRGTKVYVPPPPKKPEPSPEYLASKARLLAEAERVAYQRLLNPTYTPSPDHADPYAPPPDAPALAEDTLTPSLVFNIFLSVVITGFSVYWALTKFTMPSILARTFASWTGPQGESQETSGGASDAVRVLISFFAALSVAVAEAFLYGAYLGKVERARAKERKLQERKTFVGTVESEKAVESVESAESVDADQKDEIWGKGVNGGVRRRVREKWEKRNEKG